MRLAIDQRKEYLVFSNILQGQAATTPALTVHAQAPHKCIQPTLWTMPASLDQFRSPIWPHIPWAPFSLQKAGDIMLDSFSLEADQHKNVAMIPVGYLKALMLPQGSLPRPFTA